MPVFNGLARLADGHAKAVVAVTVVFFVVAAYFGGNVAEYMGPYGDEDPATESVRSERALEDAGFRAATGQVLVSGVDVQGSKVDRKEVEQIAERVRGVEGVKEVTGFAETGSPGFVSDDGNRTLLLFSLDSTDDTERQQAAARVQEELAGDRGVLVGGDSIAEEQVNEQVSKDLTRAEIMVFPLLFLLSLVFFRGLVAAALPLVVGAISIVGTFLALRIATELGEVSVFSLNLTIGLGLGLAIDYSLFIISRYREEIAESGPGIEAMSRTLGTAGRTVLFSAITVAVSLAALLIFPQRFLYSMGLGGMIVALLSLVVALVVLPAILTLLGDRVNALSPKFLRRREATDSDRDYRGFWYRLSRFVMARPLPIATIAILLLLIIATPALKMAFAPVDSDILPEGTSARVVSNIVDAEFPGGDLERIQVAVSTDSKGEAEQVRETVANVRQVAEVSPPERVKANLYLLEASSTAGYMDGQTVDAVEGIRGIDFGGGTVAEVTGNTARYLDFEDSLASHVPVVAAIVIGATLIILFLMTGSVILPIKSLLMNILTLAAVFGILVFVFQDGNLSGVLDFESIGGLDLSTPILIFAITFGLSTDYAVFLLSRIKEAYDGGLPNDEAVAVGLQRTGRIVTAAALLFAIAIGAFATSQIVFIKELGVGTALAVLIDATIIRALLVPALMEMLGKWNWWAPDWMKRLHRKVGLSE
ncbi:MAG: MMPL family transporter [Solirubrobacterales bacterium]